MKHPWRETTPCGRVAGKHRSRYRTDSKWVKKRGRRYADICFGATKTSRWYWIRQVRFNRTMVIIYTPLSLAFISSIFIWPEEDFSLGMFSFWIVIPILYFANYLHCRYKLKKFK